MKLVKTTDAYSIYLRRDGRHAVTGADKAPINGDDKARILVEEGLVKASIPAEPAAAEAETAEAGADEAAADASADESGADAADEE